MTSVSGPRPYKKKNPQGTWVSFKDHAEAVEKICAQQPTQAAVPEGWRLVPIDPTEAMMSAGAVPPPIGGLRERYKAMLNAAPDSGEGS